MAMLNNQMVSILSRIQAIHAPQIQNAIMIGLMFCRLSRGTSRDSLSVVSTEGVRHWELGDGDFMGLNLTG